jgi:hypothetical protein
LFDEAEFPIGAEGATAGIGALTGVAFAIFDAELGGTGVGAADEEFCATCGGEASANPTGTPISPLLRLRRKIMLTGAGNNAAATTATPSNSAAKARPRRENHARGAAEVSTGAGEGVATRAAGSIARGTGSEVSVAGASGTGMTFSGTTILLAGFATTAANGIPNFRAKFCRRSTMARHLRSACVTNNGSLGRSSGFCCSIGVIRFRKDLAKRRVCSERGSAA